MLSNVRRPFPPALATAIRCAIYGLVCVGCLDGLVYDGQAGAWVACETCKGTGRAVMFVYASPARRRRPDRGECVGCSERFEWGELVEVGDDNLTFFENDLVCESCAVDHGVL